MKAVIFDIGGVLASDIWQHMLLDETDGLARLYNLDFQVTDRVARRLWDEYSRRTVRSHDDIDQLERAYWADFSAALNVPTDIDSFISRTDAFIEPVPGMMSLVRDLRSNGTELAICSNNTEFWFRRQAKKLSLFDFIPENRIVLSCRNGNHKSSPGYEMYKAAVDILSIDRAECLVIDDRYHNIEKANDFGLAGILFQTGAVTGARYLRPLLAELGLLPAR